MTWISALLIAAPAAIAFSLPPRSWLLWLAWPVALLFGSIATALPIVAAFDPVAAGYLKPAVFALLLASAGLFCNLAGAADLEPWARRLAACGALFVGWAAGAGMATVVGSGVPMLRPLTGP
ncbi:MAG: hypothetical protein KAY22_07445 [Rhizorhabdus sp.]|uniref:hypothetical protein n=1 Tax=Rhizorhabdus sp. TaxID=1968843 RepID=UPI001B65BED4|nr:hypothetical protein [Rhizorhabdus sp.]MBP8232123.1 hypothetical protein [Rhizorhabdus sp.]